MRRFSRVDRLTEEKGSVAARVLDVRTGGVSVEKFDAAILATGYERPSLEDLMPSVAPYINLDDHGEVVLSRRYLVETSSPIGGNIYMQGVSENRHGLTATLLSALSVRGQEIFDDIKMKSKMHASNHFTESRTLE